MATDARMATPTDLVTLAQWLSPAFPVGSYSYSHGLETLVQSGKVADEDTLTDWVDTVLRFGAGRSDALLLAAAHAANTAEDIDRIDATCRAFASSRERLQETDWQGHAFCDAVSAVWGFDLAHLTYPVAVGRAARLAKLDPLTTAQFYLHAFLSNLVAAGMRLSVTGQTGGQRIIQHLTPLCAEIAKDTACGDLDALSSTAFLSDIAAMHHETQYSRIFRT